MKKEVCDSCGVETREGTQFCYNCGKNLGGVEAAADIGDDEQAALHELGEKLKVDEAETDKLAKAASERKKARGVSRQPQQFKWEPVDDPGYKLAGLAVVVAILTFTVVAVAMLWK